MSQSLAEALQLKSNAENSSRRVLFIVGEAWLVAMAEVAVRAAEERFR